LKSTHQDSRLLTRIHGIVQCWREKLRGSRMWVMRGCKTGNAGDSKHPRGWRTDAGHSEFDDEIAGVTRAMRVTWRV